MSTESPRQPPFYCPACGKKHRADLSALQQQDGAVAKVTCHRCEAVMSLRLGDDGLPKCEAQEPIGGAMSQSASNKPSLLLPMAAAAIIAVVASVGVGLALKPAPAGPAEDPRVEALEKQVESLRGEVATLREQVQQTTDELAADSKTFAARIDGAEKAVASLGETVTGMEQRTAKLATSFLGIQKDHEDHAGRIEANRVAAFQLRKKVEALEK